MRHISYQSSACSRQYNGFKSVIYRASMQNNFIIGESPLSKIIKVSFYFIELQVKVEALLIEAFESSNSPILEGNSIQNLKFNCFIYIQLTDFNSPRACHWLMSLCCKFLIMRSPFFGSRFVWATLFQHQLIYAMLCVLWMELLYKNAHTHFSVYLGSH